MNDRPASAIAASILLVANYEPDRQRSMQRYSELLQRSLQEAGCAAPIWKPPVVAGRWLHSEHRLFKWVGYVDKLLLAPLALLWAQRGHARVHVCDHSNAYYSFVVWGRPCTATCHDVIAIEAAHGLIPGWHVGRFGRALQALISAGLGAVSQVHCVSAHTRDHLLALRLAPPGRVKVAVNPLAPAFFRPPGPDSAAWASVRARLGPRYFIHVGSDLPRKNRRALFDILAHVLKHQRFEDCRLLLVGPEPSREQAAQLQALGIADRVHAVWGLEDADLTCAYRHAVALIFPSLQEGFGWPIAEAQACGCPVFAHGDAPMPEVGGDAARYFDAGDPAGAASLIVEADLEAMRAAGRLNAQRFELGALARAVLA